MVLLLSVFALNLFSPIIIGNNVFAQGHYKNGKGSSHKGGHYKNSSTNDHYRKRH